MNCDKEIVKINQITMKLLNIKELKTQVSFDSESKVFSIRIQKLYSYEIIYKDSLYFTEKDYNFVDCQTMISFLKTIYNEYREDK